MFRRRFLGKLDDLIQSGHIKGYLLDIVDMNGNLGQTSDSRNTEILIIEFHDGKTLTIETFCSGSNENTVLFVS